MFQADTRTLKRKTWEQLAFEEGMLIILIEFVGLKWIDFEHVHLDRWNREKIKGYN